MDINTNQEEIKEKKQVNKKIIIISIIFSVLLISVIGIAIAYNINENIRNYIDYNVLKKEISEQDTKEISLSSETNSYIYSYDRYIGILNNNSFQAYNSFGKKEFELSVTITNPIFENRKKYLAIAEKNGKKIYMISGKNLLWQTEIEGEIIKININKNGYMSVIVSQSTHKTVILTFDSKGRELFRTFLSDSYAIDTDISNDNKNLAIAEINTDGSQIKSSIRILSIDKIENNIENSIENATNFKKDMELGKMILEIRYNDSNNLTTMYDDEIKIIKGNEEKTLIKFSNNTLFANIDLNKAVIEVKQGETEELNTKTITYITNILGNNILEYEVNAIPKEIVVCNNVLSINTGTEAHFISNNGSLIKKYVSKQEIKKIILGDSVAGVVYKNKINIIKL